jgi:hypothetical protein
LKHFGAIFPQNRTKISRERGAKPLDFRAGVFEHISRRRIGNPKIWTKPEGRALHHRHASATALNVDQEAVPVASRPFRCAKTRRFTAVVCHANSALIRHSAMAESGDKARVSTVLDEESSLLDGLI